MAKKSKLTGNYKTCPYSGSYMCPDCFYYDTCYLNFDDDEILELVPEDELDEDTIERLKALGINVGEEQ